MEKILNSLPLGLLLAYSGKLIVTGASSSDAIIVCAVCALISVIKYAETNKSVKDLSKIIDESNRKLELMDKDNSEVRAYVSSIKLNNTYSQNKARQ